MISSFELTKQELIDLLGDNKLVYAKIGNVSSSGMTRKMDFFIAKDSHLYWLNRSISKIAGFKADKANGRLIVHGCGMDMVFHVVSTLST